MKPTDTLTTLFQHNLWANLRLLERCAELSSDQLQATVLGTFGSIRDTLQHIVLSEYSYFWRVSTGQPRRAPDDTLVLSLAEMADMVRTAGAGLIEWSPKVEPDDTVQVDWDGTPRDVPKAIFLTQVINHATEHRAQIMMMLTQLGIEPPDLDSWSYFDELDQ